MTIQDTLIESLKRLKPYLLENPQAKDGRVAPYNLNHAQLTRDITDILGVGAMRSLQRYVIDMKVIQPVRMRTSMHESYSETGIDLARTRAFYKLRRNTGRKGALIIGQMSYTDVVNLTGANTHRHHCAAIVYCLIKQGVLMFTNLGMPDNAHLMYNIRTQSPALFEFLRTNHIKNLLTTEPYALMTTDVVSDYRPINKETSDLCKHPTVTTVPDDATYTDMWGSFTNREDFKVLAEPLTVLLGYLAELPSETNDKIALIINPELMLPHRRTLEKTLFPQIYANNLTSLYGLRSVSLMRVLLTSRLGRPDLWAGWRGDADKRLYAESNGAATKGSQNRHVGWACQRLEEDFSADARMDLNPTRLFNRACMLIAENKPYRTIRDATPYEQMMSAPVFNTQHAQWHKKDSENIIEDLDSTAIDSRY